MVGDPHAPLLRVAVHRLTNVSTLAHCAHNVNKCDSVSIKIDVENKNFSENLDPSLGPKLKSRQSKAEKMNDKGLDTVGAI